jgi:hypothetical protein
MKWSILVVSILTFASAASAQERDPYGRAFALQIGIGGGMRVSPDLGSLDATLAGLIPLGDIVVLEIITAIGAVPADNTHDARLWLDLTLGARIESRTTPVRAYGSIRVAALHDAALHLWGDHFVRTITTEEGHGVGHLTMLGGAAGAAWDVPGTRRNLVLSAELEVLGLLHSTGQDSPALLGTLSINAAWVFF